VSVRDRIGFLVISGPDDPNTPVWKSDVNKGLQEGREVYLYLIDRGVLHMADDRFFESFSAHLRLYACAYGCRRYGVSLAKPAVFSGLAVLSHLLAGCRVFVSFPPIHDDPGEEWPLDGARSVCHSKGKKDRRAVLYIRWDPRVSHLPVEGLRIGAGLSSGWSNLTILLNRAATPLIGLAPDEMVDGDNRDTYLDILAKSGAVFCHEADLAMPEDALTRRQITAEEKNRLLSGSQRLIVV